MKRLNNLIVIGTSHISSQSVQEVEQVINQEQPQIIAVELDKNRLTALISNNKRKLSISALPTIGVKGYLFALIGSYIQKKMGKVVNIEPGSEMLTAINLAKKNKVDLALIDQPIEITLQRFSREFTWKEKWRVIIDILLGLVQPKKQLKKYQLENFDLRTVPEEKAIIKLLKVIKKRYPSLYKVLIEERNQYISSRLISLINKNTNKKIVAVVGAGHEEEIIRLVKKKVKNNVFIT